MYLLNKFHATCHKHVYHAAILWRTNKMEEEIQGNKRFKYLHSITNPGGRVNAFPLILRFEGPSEHFKKWIWGPKFLFFLKISSLALIGVNRSIICQHVQVLLWLTFPPFHLIFILLLYILYCTLYWLIPWIILCGKSLKIEVKYFCIHDYIKDM